MVKYHLVREPDGIACVTRDDGQHCALLDPRYDLRNHSPGGFNWGYGGSGPAQLALAICADALGNDELARELYQPYKWKVIAALDPKIGHTLTAEEVVEFAANPANGYSGDHVLPFPQANHVV